MCQASLNRRLVLPWLVVGLVFGCFARAGLAAEEQAEPKPPPTVAAPAEEPPDELVTKVFYLKYARGDTILSAIRPVAPEAQVQFDSRLNCLIVVAPQKTLGRMQELVETLDTPPDVQLEVFRLKYATIETVVSTMADLVPDARMTVDSRSNSIIVAASKAAIQRVEELLQTLDVPPDRDQAQPGQFQVYPLQHVEAAAAVRALQMLMISPGEPSGPAAHIRIDADPKTNRLLVYAPLVAHMEIKALLDKLDAPAERGGGQQFKVFELVHSEAAALAETVSGLFDAEELTISVDTTANRLLAKGPEAALEVLEALLLRLDNEEAQKSDPRRITTYHVRVVWLASGLPEGTGTEPAPDLGEVLAELAKVGVSGLRQVGQAMIHTLPDGQFEITCSPMLGEAQTEMRIDGQLKERQGTPYLDISLSAKQAIFVPAPSPPGRPESNRPMRIKTEGVVDLQTEITAPYGHYVVLGVTPVRETTSVFVVRVTESDLTSPPAEKEQESGDR